MAYLYNLRYPFVALVSFTSAVDSITTGHRSYAPSGRGRFSRSSTWSPSKICVDIRHVLRRHTVPQKRLASRSLGHHPLREGPCGVHHQLHSIAVTLDASPTPLLSEACTGAAQQRAIIRVPLCIDDLIIPQVEQHDGPLASSEQRCAGKLDLANPSMIHPSAAPSVQVVGLESWHRAR
ncbi:hypothetical protein DFH94DRAFT_703212 [Russula ochroleuca]|uniref:Uncharacterized protein n=1 Tax=Russula ochroleuca TaxID=152965 RepID=A0A9P5MM74_9AGAM|nr:hypothetical protein DFH94DRAFT_789223 [Russula ochroleuca]KAF8487124.1 hypothetical protein DFH94DRAFT_703212 [Russula ochroleuca]